MSKHIMTTRSKKYDISSNDDNTTDDELDSDGNLKDFIVNDMKSTKEIIIKKRKRKKNKHRDKLGEMVISYLLFNATQKANENIKHRRKRKEIMQSYDKNSLDYFCKPRKKLTHEKINDFLQNNIDTDSEYSEAYNEDIDTDNTYDTDEDYHDAQNTINYESTENCNQDTDDPDFVLDENLLYEEDTDDNMSLSEYSEDILNSDDITSSNDDTSPDLTSDSKITNGENESESERESESESETLFEYDELDEKYENIIDKNSYNTDDGELEYFHYLTNERKKELIVQTQKIYDLHNNNIPIRFKIIESDMDVKTKSIAINNFDKLSEMDVSTGEYSKLDHWITGLTQVPFGKYSKLPVDNNSTDIEKKEFITNTFNILNNAIYGHLEAKTHILQVIGKWIRNPHSGGNVLAIQGPMGNGKTTLVKDGISKALKRPFAFIALGGASDSSYFDGHCYTYEGSNWGRIVQILQDSKCMNPVFYFDELDKISDTQKGEEIIHLLTHLTDSSQNSLFQDNYYPGIYLDLSKALFIFSYNDDSKINKILKDRMYTISTKGFKTDDKIKISRNFLIPKIFTTYNFTDTDIIIQDNIITKIIDKFTNNEEGVRNLNRCLESIISKINIYNLTNDKVELSFKIDQFQLPFTVQDDHLDILLNINNNNNNPPPNMYL